MNEQELQELAELEELERLEALEAQEQQMKTEAQASVDAQTAENQSVVDDIVQGAATIPVAIAESVPGAKQIGSMINAGADMILAEDRNESFSEAYQRNLSDVNSVIDNFRETNPGPFFATDVAVQAGLAAATAGGTIAADLGIAAASAASRYRGGSVTEQLEQTLGGTALAGAFMGLGRAVSGVASKLGKKFARVSEETTIGALNPGVNKKVLRNTNNIVKYRYKGDYELAAKHADEVMGLSGNTPITGPKQVAENLDNARADIGSEIEEIIDYVDDSSFLLNGDKKPINGGILQAELKNSVSGNQRFRRDLPDVLQDDFAEIDQFIDDLTLENKMIKPERKVMQRVDAPNYGGGNHSKMEETIEAAEYEKVARDLGVKDIFKMKVKVANKIEDIFAKKLNGQTMTPSKIAAMKQQQARIVGKFSDAIDKQAKIVAEETGDQVAMELADLNKKYAMANHLAGLAHETVSTTSFSAPQIFKDLTSFKGLFVGSAIGIQTGNPVIAGGVMIAQALAKQPQVPFKTAQGLAKLSRFMQKFPNERVSQRAMVAIQSASNPDELQKQIGGIVAEIDLIESVQAGEVPIKRNSKHVIGMRNTIGAVIREQMGDDAANQFQEAVDSEDTQTIGAMMDQLSKVPSAKKYIEDGIGWDGMVYDPADKAQLEEEVRRADLPAAQEIMLLEELKQNKIPQIEPLQPTTRSWTPRDRSKHQY